MYWREVEQEWYRLLMSQLSEINFRQFQPCPELSPYIQSYWSIKRSAAKDTAPAFFLHPDGGTGLVFNFADAWWLDGENFDSTYLFSGPTQHTSRLNLTGNIDAFGIRFYPGMAYPFLRQSLAEIQTHIAPSESIFNSIPLTEVMDQLHSADALINRIAAIERHLIRRLRLTKHDLNCISYSLRWLNQQQGQATISDLSAQCSISQRQLERSFKNKVGMSAKQYNKLLRVRNSRTLIHAQSQNRTDTKSTSLSDIALMAGYYDQPHFNREFKSVIGISPGQFMKKVINNSQ
ncbi:helix-turn-helix domain-containing protein [Amphritea balenae]|nr:helix-turn-helix domain-containing protein [Amphritea balenae]